VIAYAWDGVVRILTLYILIDIFLVLILLTKLNVQITKRSVFNITAFFVQQKLDGYG